MGERLEIEGEVLAVGASQHPRRQFVGVGGGKVGVAGLVGQLDDGGRSEPSIEMVMEENLGSSADAVERGRPDVRTLRLRVHTED